MKKYYRFWMIVLPVLIAALFVTNGSLFAQDAEPPTPVEDLPDVTDIQLPFIDRDSDGINDLLQNGWGLRFVERYKKRQELWNQLNVEIIRGEDGKSVDTDGDGKGDVPFHDFMKNKMNELIDTDGDGEKDTPIKDYIGRRFKSFDNNGDGLPDDLTKEDFKARIKEMKQWRKEIHNRVKDGLPAFVDDDGDGIPDNLPGGFKWRGHKKR